MRLFGDRDDIIFLQRFEKAIAPENKEEMIHFTDREMEIFYMGYRLAQFSDMYRSIKEINEEEDLAVSSKFIMFLWENFGSSNTENLKEFERIANKNILSVHYFL